MLPHAIYFETLAGIADETSPEWHATVAGLVVLRLVDDWLDFGPHVVSTDISGLIAVRASIAHVPPGNPVRGLLAQIVDVMGQADKSELRVVTAPLLAYAKALHYEGLFELSRNVLESLQARALERNDTETLIRTSLQLGLILHDTGCLDQAEENYLKAELYARSVGDTEHILLARLGEAKITTLRGNLPLGDSVVAQVVEDAGKAAIPYIRGRALHQRANIAYSRSDYQSTIRFAYQALDCLDSHIDRDRAMGDLALAFLNVGHFAAARDTNLILASCAQEQSVRWRATINLMYGAAFEHQESAFELYKATLDMSQLPSRIELDYRWVAGVGFRLLGYAEKALEELQKAHAIATQLRIHQSIFEIEEDMAKTSVQIPVACWEPDIDSIAQAIEAQLRLQTS